MGFIVYRLHVSFLYLLRSVDCDRFSSFHGECPSVSRQLSPYFLLFFRIKGTWRSIISIYSFYIEIKTQMLVVAICWSKTNGKWPSFQEGIIEGWFSLIFEHEYLTQVWVKYLIYLCFATLSATFSSLSPDTTYAIVNRYYSLPATEKHVSFFSKTKERQLS